MMFSTRTLKLGLFLALGLTSVAQANPADSLLSAKALPAAADMATTDVGEVSYLDFSEMGAAWWKDFSRACAHTLLASDDEAQERAMRNVIFFATHYPGEADLRRTTPKLLRIYFYDRDEQRRLLALAALSAIGDDSAMLDVAQEVEHERSTRVRRLATAAVNNHFAE